jgi:hypothetical protein
MRNAIRILLFVVPVVILAGTSCIRPHTSTTEKLDSTKVEKADTGKAKLADENAPEKVREIIKEVFMEVEKDCPQLAKKESDGTSKAQKLKKKIQDQTNLQKMTGGWIFANSHKLGTSVRIDFKGDQPTAYWNQKLYSYTKTITITKKPTILRQALNVWFLWVPAWIFFLLWLYSKFT